MDDGVLQAALALPEEDRRELAERIRESLVSREEGDPGSCPRCGCSHVVRRGRDADGAQRWLCRGCGRTFTARTGGLVALSKLPLGTWLAYVDATLEGASLRGCAKRCSVSLPTSWYMRMRLCDVMGSQLRAFRGGAGTSVQVDEVYLDESLKGRNPEGLMPRGPHRHGGESGCHGLSKLKIGVVTGVNARGTASARWPPGARPASRGCGPRSPGWTWPAPGWPPTGSAPTSGPSGRRGWRPTTGTTRRRPARTSPAW